jgi:hypothetical protein
MTTRMLTTRSVIKTMILRQPHEIIYNLCTLKLTGSSKPQLSNMDDVIENNYDEEMGDEYMSEFELDDHIINLDPIE